MSITNRAAPVADSSTQGGVGASLPSGAARTDDETSPRIIIPCEHCGSEGRIYVSDGCSWHDGPRERDTGPCPTCEGTGGEIIEAEPVDLDDLEWIQP